MIRTVMAQVLADDNISETFKCVLTQITGGDNNGKFNS